jgi:hypothetical protein
MVVNKLSQGRASSRELQLKLLNDKELAELLNVSVSTLRRWRLYGQGPPWIKVNGFLVRYKLDSVEKWLSDNLAGAR